MVALNKLRHVSNRIKLVKYEDFVGQTENTLEDLYKFLGLSYLLPFARHAIKNHIQAEPQEIKWDKVLEGENVGKMTSKYSVTIYLLFFLGTMEPNLLFKGQLISEQIYAVLNFQKMPRNIARISALASKMSQIKKVKAYYHPN